MVVRVGCEGTAIDAGGGGGEEAEVGFESEDDGVGAGVAAAAASPRTGAPPRASFLKP